MGDTCFAEDARAAADAATVVVVNTHLYAIDIATRGAVLPEHDLAVIDEAHHLEDVVSSVAGFELSGARVFNMRRIALALLLVVSTAVISSSRICTCRP